MDPTTHAEEKPHGLRHDFKVLVHARSAIIDTNDWQCTTVAIHMGDRSHTISLNALRTCVAANTDTGGIVEQIVAAFDLACSGQLARMPSATLMADGNIFVRLGNASSTTPAARLVKH